MIYWILIFFFLIFNIFKLMKNYITLKILRINLNFTLNYILKNRK